MSATTATPPADRLPPSLSECLRVAAGQLQTFKFQLFAELRALGFPKLITMDGSYYDNLANQTWRELDETWLNLFQNYPELAAGTQIPAAFLDNNMKQETALVAMQEAGTALGFGLADGVRTLRAALYSMTFKKEQQVADFTQDPTKDPAQRSLVALLWKDVTDQESSPTDKGQARQKLAEQRQQKWQQEVAGWHLSAQQSQDVGLLLAAAQQKPAPAAAPPPVTTTKPSRKKPGKKTPAPALPAGGPPIAAIPVSQGQTLHKDATRRGKKEKQ